MPVIEQPEPPVRAQVAKTLGRHIEAVLLGIGFLLGAVVATVAGVLT